MATTFNDVPNQTKTEASVDATTGTEITVSKLASALFVLFEQHKGEVQGPGSSDWVHVAADTWTLVGQWGGPLSGSRVIKARRHGGSGTVTVHSRQS